ncbi:MAG: hypothetical protein PUP93_34110 [Rhizonema sp. NSF051]|nr:hypothetical protein [Rhizonema sp. NSF051]
MSTEIMLQFQVNSVESLTLMGLMGCSFSSPESNFTTATPQTNTVTNQNSAPSIPYTCNVQTSAVALLRCLRMSSLRYNPQPVLCVYIM